MFSFLLQWRQATYLRRRGLPVLKLTGLQMAPVKINAENISISALGEGALSLRS